MSVWKDVKFHVRCQSWEPWDADSTIQLKSWGLRIGARQVDQKVQSSDVREPLRVDTPSIPTEKCLPRHTPK